MVIRDGSLPARWSPSTAGRGWCGDTRSRSA